jgi:hypothetical protein
MIVFVIIGLFIFKLASGWLASKWPNGVTKAVDTVVQTA